MLRCLNDVQASFMLENKGLLTRKVKYKNEIQRNTFCCCETFIKATTYSHSKAFATPNVGGEYEKAFFKQEEKEDKSSSSRSTKNFSNYPETDRRKVVNASVLPQHHVWLGDLPMLSMEIYAFPFSIILLNESILFFSPLERVLNPFSSRTP